MASAPVVAVKNTFIHLLDAADKPPELRRVSSAPCNLHESLVNDSKNHKMPKVRKTMLKDSKNSQKNSSRYWADFEDASCEPMECDVELGEVTSQSQVTELPADYVWGAIAMPVTYPAMATAQQVGSFSNATHHMMHPMPLYKPLPSYDSKTFEIFPEGLEGQVWQNAIHPDGCRLVQKALDEAPTDAARSAVVKELHTHVSEALRSPNANHVLQKCISTMPQYEFQFIITEMVQAGPGAVVAAARHQYGCRILQRLLEFSSPAQLEKLIEDLLEEAVSLCRDVYASFVLQHLLQHGIEKHVSRLVRLLAANVSTIGSDPYGVTVIEKALASHAPGQDRIGLAHALAAEPNLLLSMTLGRHGRHGHNVSKLALKLSAPDHREFALLSLQQRRQVMTASRYGKKLLNCVDELLRQR